MTITTIYQIFFSWDEYDEMCKFESTHEQYRKISEDSLGTKYEYRTDYIVHLNKEES